MFKIYLAGKTTHRSISGSFSLEQYPLEHFQHSPSQLRNMDTRDTRLQRIPQRDENRAALLLQIAGIPYFPALQLFRRFPLPRLVHSPDGPQALPPATSSPQSELSLPLLMFLARVLLISDEWQLYDDPVVWLTAGSKQEGGPRVFQSRG
ncbi:hypothetical protein LXL04_026925 [Taraxacum kok-saghyz]